MVEANLYTSGGEFTLPNGDDYIGGFHIHSSQGAMAGSFHKTEQHDLLSPANNKIADYVKRTQRKIKQTPAPTSTSPSPSGRGGY
jgi:hypothetical protein|tara:strand:+ start:696 stop:950 length:255 start_codon:yes stop_codon:yes gene_type:complete